MRKKVYRYFASGVSFLMVCVAVSDTSAGLIVQPEDITLSSSGAATQAEVEVYLDLTGADDGGSIDVGNYQVRVELAGLNAGTDVVLSQVTDTTSLEHPQARPLDINNVLLPTQGFASTFNFASPFNLADQSGLLKLVFDIAPNVIGDYTISVLAGAGNSEFTDPVDFMTPMSYTAGVGVLSIQGTAVPEPNAFLLLLVSLVGITLWRRRRLEGGFITG